jgi:4-amino-4-deoxy-L-arabinose transferase-like glycosyltransferase
MPRRLGLSFAAVLVVWLVARVVFFNGYYTEDAPGYVGDAIAIALGEYGARNHVNGLNVGTYAPVAIPLVLLGKTDLALSVWPLLCSLLGVLSMAGIAALLFGRGFAAIAALLYATYPGDVFFSTVVMPDAIQSGWLSLSLFLVTFACTRSTANRHSGRIIVAAGVAMGVCHLIRANGVLLLPIGFFGIAALSVTTARESWRLAFTRAALFLAGWAAVFVLEGVVYLVSVGDFLFRVHVVDRHYGQSTSIAQWGLNTHPLTIPFSAFAPLTWWKFGVWWDFNPEQAYHGLLFTFAVLASVAALLSLRRVHGAHRARLVRGFAFAVVWLAWPLLYHQFGSQSLTQFIPIHRLSRHLVVYAPGAIAALAAGCAVLWSAARTRHTRVALTLTGVILFVLHLAFNVQAERIAYDGYHRIKDTYTRIRDHLPADTRTIVADPGDLGFFDFWLNPLGEMRVQLHAFAQYPQCETLPDGIVLTFSNPGWERLAAPAIQETVARLPCLLQPPSNWRLLYDGYPERIFRIAR